MTTTTTTATAPQAPAFQAPQTDNYRELGRAALLFLLAQGDTATWRLDDGQLTAAADYASIATTARDMSVPAIERIAQLQGWCRRLVAARAASAAALAALQAAQGDETGAGAAPAPIVDQAGSQGPAQGGQGGGGGSKVPRKPRPTGPTSPAALPAPVAAPVAVTGPAGIPARFTAISPAQPALRPVPAISLAAEDLF